MIETMAKPQLGFAEAGPGATIVEVFWDQVDRSPERPALRHRGEDTWESISWGEYGAAVTEVGAGLVAVGLEPGDRASILSANQPRWHEADVAILAVGCASVPAYPTSTSGQVAYLLRHSGARVCFVADRDQLAKILLRRHELPDLERVVVFGEAPDGLDDDFVLTFDELREMGRARLEEHPTEVRDRSRAISHDDVATIVYTSGTTGPPKGAVLTFANLAATIRSITDVVPIGPDDRFLSFLPLSHIAERTVSHFGQITSGGETWFARGLSTVVDDLRACRPTVFFAVPRVWEKFQDGVVGHLADAPRPARALAEVYLRAAHDRATATAAGTRQTLPERARYLALDRLVGRSIRKRAGLDRARVLVSGAAPIDPELLWWFYGVGLPVAEVYGQTEDGGPTTLNPPDAIHIGSVGKPMPGLEVRIAPDGEILARGPAVTPGYFHDEEHTAELLDAEGWMHSGDLGRLDADGYLHMTGRKKDLIVTSSGKNIAPQELETKLRGVPLISQAVVVGDGRSYLTALIALDAAEAERWAHEHHKVGSLETLRDDQSLREEIAEGIEHVNEQHAPIEQIKTWRIVPRELTVASGELTPTLKVKRDVVATRFGELIDEMYAAAP